MGLAEKIKKAFLTLLIGSTGFFSLNLFYEKNKWNKAIVNLDSLIKQAEFVDDLKKSNESMKDEKAISNIFARKNNSFFVVDGNHVLSFFLDEDDEEISNSDLADKITELHLESRKKTITSKYNISYFYVYNSEKDLSFLVESTITRKGTRLSIDNIHSFKDSFVYFKKGDSFFKINCENGEINQVLTKTQYGIFASLNFFLIPLSVFSLLYLLGKNKKNKTFLSHSSGKPLKTGLVSIALTSSYFYILNQYSAIEHSTALNITLKSLFYNLISTSLSSKILSQLENPIFKTFLRTFLTPFYYITKSKKLDEHSDKVNYKEDELIGHKFFAKSLKKDYSATLYYWQELFKKEYKLDTFDNILYHLILKIFPIRAMLTTNPVKKNNNYLSLAQAYLNINNHDKTYKYFSRINHPDTLVLALELSSMANLNFTQNIFEKYFNIVKHSFKSFGSHPVFEIKFQEKSLANYAHVIKKGSETSLNDEFNELKKLETLINSENLSGVIPLIPICVGKYNDEYYLIERRIHGKTLNETEDISNYCTASQILALSHAKSSKTGTEKDYNNYITRFKSKFPEIENFSGLLDNLYSQPFVFDEDGHDFNFIVCGSNDNKVFVTKIDRASRPDVAYGIDLGRLFMRKLDSREDSIKEYIDNACRFSFHVDFDETLRNSAFGQVFAALSFGYYEIDRNRNKTKQLLDNASLVIENFDKKLSKNLNSASQNL